MRVASEAGGKPVSPHSSPAGRQGPDPGILIGTFLGSSLAVRLPELALRLVFAAVLGWTGTKYVRTRRPVTSES